MFKIITKNIEVSELLYWAAYKTIVMLFFIKIILVFHNNYKSMFFFQFGYYILQIIVMN